MIWLFMRTTLPDYGAEPCPPIASGRVTLGELKADQGSGEAWRARTLSACYSHRTASDREDLHRVKASGAWLGNCRHQMHDRADRLSAFNSPTSPDQALGFRRAVVIRRVIGHHSNQVAQRFLVSSVCQRSEVAGEIEKQSSLRRRLDRLIVTQTFEKEIDVDTERLRDRVETARRYAVDPLLVFMCLLIRDANHFCQMVLTQPEKDAPLADSRAHVIIHILGARTLPACPLVGQLMYSHRWCQSLPSRSGRERSQADPSLSALCWRRAPRVRGQGRLRKGKDGLVTSSTRRRALPALHHSYHGRATRKQDKRRNKRCYNSNHQKEDENSIAVFV
jgi:hypothetical protein